MRKIRRRHRFRMIVAATLATAVGYAVLAPLAIFLFHQGHPEGAGFVGSPVWLADQLRVRTSEFVVCLWVFALGASFGSFLNVVIYRLPRGMSLLGSSRCPYCRTRISARDNVPVVGWLLLAGRCRTCRLPISPRYPLVEFAVGSVFLVLAGLELFGAGLNLPGSAEPPLGPASWLVGHVRWELVKVCSYHCLLMAFLITSMLIQADGFSVPRALIGVVIAAGLLVPGIFHDVHPVPWSLTVLSAATAGASAMALLTATIGWAAGGCLGIAIDGLWAARASARTPARRDPEEAGSGTRTSGVDPSSGPSEPVPVSPQPPSRPPAVRVALSVVGLYLGWQAALGTALAAAALQLAAMLALSAKRCRRIPRAGTLVVAAFLQVCFWKATASTGWWPGPGSGPLQVGVLVGLLVCLTLATAAVSARMTAGTK
jgi:leader peptidase (prepilin peptidase)/N-methyltransferase